MKLGRLNDQEYEYRVKKGIMLKTSKKESYQAKSSSDKDSDQDDLTMRRER